MSIPIPKSSSTKQNPDLGLWIHEVKRIENGRIRGIGMVDMVRPHDLVRIDNSPVDIEVFKNIICNLL